MNLLGMKQKRRSISIPSASFKFLTYSHTAIHSYLTKDETENIHTELFNYSKTD